MSQNPFESPLAENAPQKAIGINSGSREDLRAVATFQKGIVICILIYLLAIVTQFVIPPELRLFLGIAILINGLVGTVFVFLLAMKVYSTVTGILLGILTLVPCINLLVLLMVNGKATSVLKQNGISVGLMGANMSQL